MSWDGQDVFFFSVQFIKLRILSSGVQEKHKEASRSFYQGLGKEDWAGLGNGGGQVAPTMGTMKIT